MRYYFSLFLFFVWTNILCCQNNCIGYFRELSIAEFKNYKGDTEEALQLFERANNNYPECTGASSKLNFAKMYLSTNKPETAYEIIIEELKNGYSLDKLKFIGIFESHLEPYYSLLLQNEDSLHRIFYSNVDWEALFFVKNMIALDQGFNHFVNIPDSILWEMRHQVFRSNIQKLADYTEAHGVIGYKEIGHFYNSVSLLLVHHRLDNETDIRNVDRLIRDYTTAIKDGNVTPAVIINLMDNMAEIYDENEPQLFGKYVDHSRNEFKTIRNIDKVDSLRLSYGLNTLKEYSEMINVPLPDDYETK